MVVVTPPEQEIDGKYYTWNYRKRAYEYDAFLTASKTKSKPKKNIGKAFLGVATLNPESLIGLIEAIEGKGSDRLFRSVQDMSDEEIALSVGFLLAFTLAPAVGSKLAKSPSLKEIKQSPEFKKTFPKVSTELDEAILTQKYIYDSSSREVRLKMAEQASDYREARLREEQRLAGEKGDRKEFDRLQKEINKNPANEIKLEIRRIERAKEKARMDRMDKAVEEQLELLRDEAGNEMTETEWLNLYRMINQKNPNAEELNNFIKGELEKQIETGEEPQSIIEAWYEQYGTNEQGIDTDLQELGRRVMRDLSLDTDGLLDEPDGGLAMWVYNKYSGAEREAIVDAYNIGLWDTWVKNRKSLVMGGTSVTGAVIGAKELADTEVGEVEIEQAEQEEEDEMDLVEDVDPIVEELDEMIKEIDEVMEDTGYEGGDEGGTKGNDTGTFTYEQESINYNDLLNKTLTLSTEVYKKTFINVGDDYFLVDDYQIPVLFHKIEDTLYVAFRGTASISNLLTDLTIQGAYLNEDNNEVGSYELAKKRLNPKILDMKFHAGFLQALFTNGVDDSAVPYSKRGVIPLYAGIKRIIDKYSQTPNIVFTGHSLGGAIASMFAFFYKNDVSNNLIKNIKVVSYGCPRFIKEGYTKRYNDVIRDNIRVFNKSDVITFVPLYKGWNGMSVPYIEGFLHVGKPLCLDDLFISNSINQFASQVLKQAKPLNVALQDLPLNISSLLIKYSLGDKYIGVLLSCVFENLRKREVIDKYNLEQIYASQAETQKKIKDALGISAKVDCLDGLGIKDILDAFDFGEDETEANYGLSTIYGFVMGQNKITGKAHKLITYRENLDKELSKEAEEKVDILSGRRERPKSTQMEINEEVIKEEILNRVKRKEPNIIGFCTLPVGGLIVEI